MKTITTIIIAGITLALCGCTDAPMKGVAGGDLSDDPSQTQTGTPRPVQAHPAPPPPPSQPVIEP